MRVMATRSPVSVLEQGKRTLCSIADKHWARPRPLCPPRGFPLRVRKKTSGTSAAPLTFRRDIINLENGNWGVMARPVLKAYERHTRRVNEQGADDARRETP
jgi:hypothetical protein